MEETIEKINLNHLDKSNWETFRFDEIARRISESVDPNTTHLETYVGLEHIDAEDIHIRRFGSPDDVSGGKLNCYPGDVIFGKRRAYQRKAAIVDFGGICSAHAFVLRANPEVIDPQLFPFFLHSDQFMHRMVDISVGGLSPTINWGDLKHQEFLLPPKSEQARLAELLWAMDEVIEREREVDLKLSEYFESSIHYFTLGKRRFIDSFELEFRDSKIGLIPKDWQLTTLSEYSELITNGFVGTATPYYTTAENGIKYLQGMNVRRNKIDIKGLTYITKEFHNKQLKTQLKEGDILTVQSGHIGETAVVSYELEGANCHAVIITRLDKTKWNPHFVCYFINSPLGQVKSKGITVGTTVAHINTSELQKYFVPMPSLIEQDTIVDRLKLIESSLNKVKTEIASSKALQKSLINQIFQS